MGNIDKSLIALSNLAIPSNEIVGKGLGDLIESNKADNISKLTNTFIDRNHNFLLKIFQYINKEEETYKNFVENIYKKEDQNNAKDFFEEFRVFAIKTYFAHPYVIKKLNFFQNFVYDNIDKAKDKKILNSLNNNYNNDLNR